MMKVGNLDIENGLFLAPMAEITDSSFRQICRENGAGITFTQMVSAHGVVNGDFDTYRFFSFSRSEKPIGVQLLGSDPGVVGEATKEISKYKPDLIDLNCGCPVEKVVNNNLGSALLDDPKNIARIVRKMVDSSNGIPISTKVRLGKDKKSINIIDTAKAIEDSGASVVFVHGRTKEDRYDVDADWSWIRKIKENLSIPVVGNGSIFNCMDVKNMIDETGCDSVMVARGALGNPFIFSEFIDYEKTGVVPNLPGISTIKETLLKHIDLLERDMGEIKSLDKIKKNSIWYFMRKPGIDSLLSKIFSMKDITSIKNLIEEHVNSISENKFSDAGIDEIEKKFQKKVLFWLVNN